MPCGVSRVHASRRVFQLLADRQSMIPVIHSVTFKVLKDKVCGCICMCERGVVTSTVDHPIPSHPIGVMPSMDFVLFVSWFILSRDYIASDDIC